MTTEPPDIQAIWRNQKMETKPMSVAEIRARAERYRGWARRRVLFAMLVFAGCVAFWGALAWSNPNWIIRVGDALLIAGVLPLAWGAYRMRPGAVPGPESAGAAVLEYHRGELMRLRVPFSTLMLRAAFLLPGMIVIIVGMEIKHPGFTWAKYAPVAMLGLLWFALVLIIHPWQMRRLQRRIDELDAIRAE